MHKYIIYLFLILIFSSCKNKSNESHIDSSFAIYGNMEEGEGYSLFIKKIYSDSSLDKTIIEINPDGTFFQTIKTDKSEFYSVVNEAGNSITIYSKPGDSIKVEANYYDFSEYKLSGNIESEQITLLNAVTQEFLERISFYSSIIEDSIESPNYAEIRMNIDKEYKEEFHKLKTFSEEFIAKNEGSLISLLALSNQLGNNFFVFHPVEDKKLFYHVDSLLFSKYQGYEPVEKLHLQVNSLKRMSVKKSLFKIGDTLPDFSLPDTSGIFINLHSLRGNIVLVDFWASWCRSCMDENLKYLDLYDLYKSKGFEIVQVSLDESEKDWKTSIEQDGLPWIHLSDLKKWKSKVVELYDISSLPGNFLLNSKGEIIEMDMDAEKLKKQLEGLFITN
ncbi:MAG: redoxin domain-containing protein [Bacteroidales bacterium]|nr:redoxin domain-containing protein [Bacteroidales bacterium]